MELLLVTPRPEVWNECLPVFQRGGNTLQQAASLEDAAPIIRHTPPVLADEFHEATEGLGILMPLPTSPKADDAERLLKALAGVM